MKPEKGRHLRCQPVGGEPGVGLRRPDSPVVPPAFASARATRAIAWPLAGNLYRRLDGRGWEARAPAQGAQHPLLLQFQPRPLSAFKADQPRDPHLEYWRGGLQTPGVLPDSGEPPGARSARVTMGGRGRKGLRNLAEELNGVEQRGEGPGRREVGGGGRSAAAAGGRRARRSKSASQTLQQSPELGRRRRPRRRRRTSRPQPARAQRPWPRAAAGHG